MCRCGKILSELALRRLKKIIFGSIKNKAIELYEYRELIKNLVVKELKIRYKRSVLGFFWSFMNPLALLGIYTFVFSFLFKSQIKDFPVFLLSGLLAFNFLNNSLAGGTSSVVGNANLVRKVYFPREVLPISSVLANLVNFLLELCVLFVFLIALGYKFYLFLPLLLLVILIHTMMNIGLAMILAGVNVYLRDIQHLIMVVLLMWFFASPIVYDVSRVPARLLPYYMLNPLTVLILLYRGLLYDLKLPGLGLFVYAFLFALGSLIAGFWIFGRFSPLFAKEV